MVADRGRVYLIEDRDDVPFCEEYEWAARRLFVIDIDGGAVIN